MGKKKRTEQPDGDLMGIGTLHVYRSGQRRGRSGDTICPHSVLHKLLKEGLQGLGKAAHRDFFQ